MFAAAFFFLGWAGQPLGLGYLDPVGKIVPQDENVYAHASLRMAERGDWATPHFMGRFFLYKTPMVYWTAAASVKLLGRSDFALRLPSRLAAAGVCLLVFLWTRRYSAALLLAATPLFAEVANRTLTDALLCFWMVLAFWLLHRRQSWLGFGIVSGLAILTKSTAGLIPLLVYFGYWSLTWKQTVWWKPWAASAVAAVVAAPWFVYQFVVHPRWFWAEFVQVELLAYGAGAPPQQTTGETVWSFYGARIAATALAVVLGAILAAWKWPPREPQTILLAVWIALMVAAILSYQYRNIPYLVPLLPALAIVAGRWATWLPALLSLALLWFALPGTEPPPVRRALDRRAAMQRSNPVLIIDLAEQFYATTLPLAKVRYVLPAAEQPPEGFALDFRQLGITMPVQRFLQGGFDGYRRQMREWGLPDDEALATVIEYQSRDEINELIAASPLADIVWPDGRMRLGSAIMPR